MPPSQAGPTRRTLLLGGGCLLPALAGCLASTIDGPEQPADDATEPSTDTEPLAEDAYPLTEYDGVQIPLVTASEAYDWLVADAATAGDTREQKAYEKVRIKDAVWSPEPEADDKACSERDPLEELPTDRPIVVYGAPEADGPVRRAAALIADYEWVFVLKGGIKAWQIAAYPLAGEEVNNEGS